MSLNVDKNYLLAIKTAGHLNTVTQLFKNLNMVNGTISLQKFDSRKLELETGLSKKGAQNPGNYSISLNEMCHRIWKQMR